MIQLYMEETEDLLQKAEECIIRLEKEYSSDDANELFRIAHTIKGSSYMAGYEDIGNIMHRIEDMLDCARNGSISFDRRIVSLCFEGLDTVKRMLQFKKDGEPMEMMQDLTDSASGIDEKIRAFINANRTEEKKDAAEQPAAGFVSSLLSREPRGKNKFYISFFVEEDAPMVSPVILMILKSIEDIGALIYSSVTDSYFSGRPGGHETKTLDIILSTDIEEAELYTYFALPYVEKINITDLTRSKLEENDYYFNNNDDACYVAILGVFAKLYDMFSGRSEERKPGREELQVIEFLRCEAEKAFGGMKCKNKISAFVKDFNEFFSYITGMYNEQPAINDELRSSVWTRLTDLIERANNFAKGKHVFKVFKPEKNEFIDRLMNFTGMVDQSTTSIIFIDLSMLGILHEDEVKALIEAKRQMEDKSIEVGIIAEGPDTGRIVNIFDSIKPVEDFKLFRSEFDATLGMLYSQDSYLRIVGRSSKSRFRTGQPGC